jgi:hypothetical protein
MLRAYKAICPWLGARAWVGGSTLAKVRRPVSEEER